MSKGYGHIIVGATGTGKTTYVKSLLEKAKNAVYVYDVNNEYKIHDEVLPKFEVFTEKAAKLKCSVIVFEESTIFFSNRGTNQIVTDILVRKRHNENYIIFVFHSIRNIPRHILDLCNYITIFKTNDNPDIIRNKISDGVFKVYTRVNDSEKKFYRETIKLY